MQLKSFYITERNKRSNQHRLVSLLRRETDHTPPCLCKNSRDFNVSCFAVITDSLVIPARSIEAIARANHQDRLERALRQQIVL